MKFSEGEIQKAMEAAQRIDQMEYTGNKETRISSLVADAAFLASVFFAQNEILAPEPNWEDNFENWAFAEDENKTSPERSLMRLMWNKLQKARGEETVE